MSTAIRLAAGNITAYDLLNTESYLIRNWTRQSDMSPAIQWLAVQPNKPMARVARPSLEIGVGRYYSKFASDIQFPVMTKGMIQYVATNIFGGNDNSSVQVTAYVEEPKLGFAVFTGELIDAFANDSYTRFDENKYYGVTYPFVRATLKTIQVLGTLSGDALGTLSGDAIALENQT